MDGEGGGQGVRSAGKDGIGSVADALEQPPTMA
jgi:hypothetical protein